MSEDRTGLRGDAVRLKLRGYAVAGLIAPIRVYRAVLSPLFPPSCRFQPTCSHYAIEAIQTHGPLKGLGLALRRLARCHPHFLARRFVGLRPRTSAIGIFRT